jgi:hypothetical protein
MTWTHKGVELPTYYADQCFRSATEARWALFFSYLELDWEYEPTGFGVNGIGWQPDFWLPDLRVWFEVKAHDYPLGGWGKIEVAAELFHPLLMAAGPPGRGRPRLVEAGNWTQMVPDGVGNPYHSLMP